MTKLFSHRRYTKLTQEQVKVIKDLLRDKAGIMKLAAQFNVSRATISRIANNRTWEDVK